MSYTASIRLSLFAVFVLLTSLLVDAEGAVVDNVNGTDGPAPFKFFPDQIGWVYVPTFDYTLDGVFATFADSFGVATRDVLLSVYDEPPAAGGSLLRSALFSAGAVGGDLGATFADLDLEAGEDYFIGYENIKDIGLNIVDFGVSLPPPNNNPNPEVEFLDGWYTDPGFTTFFSFAASPGFAAPILRFTGAGNSPTVMSNWTGAGGSWTDASNWDTPDAPANGLGDTYNAVINRSGFPVATEVNVASDIEITNLDLQLGRIRLFGNSSLTVLDQTDLGPPADGFSGIEPGASVVLRPLGSEQQLVDLGMLTAFSGNTLFEGGFSLTGSGSAQATLQWSGAGIHRLGPNVELFLFGPNTSIRNSDDDSDALANLQQIDGLLEINDRVLTVTGSLTNNGQFTIGDEEITIGGGASSDPAGLSVNGTFTNTGNFFMQSESTSTLFSVAADLDNSGAARIEFENSDGGPTPFNATVGGNVFNSGALVFSDQGQSATLNVAGNLSNTGSITNEGTTSSIVIVGTVAELAGGVLADGYYETGAGMISAAQLDIQTIGSEAVIVLGSPSFNFTAPGGQIINSTTGHSALLNLEQVDGELTVHNRSLTTDDLTVTGATRLRTANVDAMMAVGGALSNTGIIEVEATTDGDANSASLVATGALAEQVGATLTSGEFRVSAGANSEAVVAWAGAQIETIGSNAAIALSGANAHLLNSSNDANALAGLAINQGQLILEEHNLSTVGDFMNQTAPGEVAPLLDVADSDFTVNGDLTNTGEVEMTGDFNSSVTGSLSNSGEFIIEGEVAQLTIGSHLINSGTMDIETDFSLSGTFSTQVVVGGNLDNTGALALDARSSDDTVVVTIHGALLQQVGNTLQAGELSVDATFGPNRSATLEWAGADIHTIASAAKVAVDGTNASIRDRLTSNNALANLASVEGSLTLSEQDFVTVGDLNVSGEMNVTSSDFTVTGNFTNSGITMFSGDSTQRTLQVDGTFSNTGEIHTFFAKVVTNEPLPQQTGTTLSDGFFLIQTDSIGAVVGEIAWAGAEITTIGPNAGVALIGAGSTIRNSQNDSDGLVGLVDNQGFFSLRLQNHNFVGDFSTSGEMELFEGVTMNFPVNSKFTNSGRLEVFGDATVIGAEVQLADSSELLVEDSFSEISFELELGKIIADTVKLDGDLIVFLDLLQPESTDQFVIVDAMNLVGVFDNVANGQRIDTQDGSGSFLVTYDLVNHDVLLTDFVATVLPGDYNDDGVVNLADYTVWRDNLGAPAGSLANDVDGGNIGQLQYGTWKANYGATVGSNAIGGAKTPEPSTLLIALVLILGGISFKHRMALLKTCVGGLLDAPECD